MNNEAATYNADVNAAIDRAWAAQQMSSPAVIYKARLSIDGDQWCALFGDNLQDGVAGFGKSPELAMQDFNRNWHKVLP